MSEKFPIRWGIIGCGDVTELKSGPAYQKTADFVLNGVTRRNYELAQDYAQRHKVEHVYKTAEELVNDTAIDAVYIATPPDSHHHYALMVAAAGKPCCIEKPLSPSYQESEEIVRAFDEAGLPLFVAYYRRTLPRFLKVKSLLDEKGIGDVRYVHWDLTSPPSAVDLSGEYNWRTDKAIARGGYFDDLASHGLDLLAYLLGDFDTVSGAALNQQGLYSAYDSISASWQHKSGISGTGLWNFASYKSVDDVCLVGTEGEIHFPVFHDEPVVLINKSGTQRFNIEHPKHVQSGHVQAMRDSLFDQYAHPSTGKTALHTSWVMEQILADGKGLA